MEKYIYKDCQRLIDAFEKEQNVAFDSFCTQWKKLSFHHIFTAQVSEVQIMQTTKVCLDFGRHVLCQNSSFLKRIGGLYLLHAIYYKQPMDGCVKITVSLDSWREMRKFVDMLRTECRAEQAQFIFWKLAKENAFRFVFTETYYNLDDLNRRNNFELPEHIDNPTVNTISRHLDEIGDDENGILSAFGLLESGYNEMKEIVNEQNDKKSKSSLPMTGIVEELKTAFEDIQCILKGEVKSKKAGGSKVDKDSIKCRRSEIKRKAIMNLGRRLQHSVTDTDRENEEEVGESSKKRPTKTEDFTPQPSTSKSK